MRFFRKFKKSQCIHINHFGEDDNNTITIFTTIRQYPKILDADTAEAVEQALKHLAKTYLEETIIQHKTIVIQVILVEN